MFIVSSCAVLTTSQVDLIKNLAIASDSIAVAPAYIFESLNEVRAERGLFYIASLSSPEAHLKELNAQAEASIEYTSITDKANLYINVLNSYLRSLKSISSSERWEYIGRELRSTGRNIDSVLVVYNKLYPENQIEIGIAKSIGEYSGFLAQGLTKYVQTSFVKEYIAMGDSLISICCDGLMEILKKNEFDQLIEIEIVGLESNYLAYLNSMEIRSYLPESEYDRQYLTLKKEIQKTKKMRNQCITALRSLKNAHHKVTQELEERKKVNQIYDELLDLNDNVFKLFH